MTTGTNPGEAAGVAPAELWVTDDAGQRWQRAAAFPAPQYWVLSAAAFRRDARGAWHGLVEGGQGAMATADTGRTWEREPLVPSSWPPSTSRAPSLWGGSNWPPARLVPVEVLLPAHKLGAREVLGGHELGDLGLPFPVVLCRPSPWPPGRPPPADARPRGRPDGTPPPTAPSTGGQGMPPPFASAAPRRRSPRALRGPRRPLPRGSCPSS